MMATGSWSNFDIDHNDGDWNSHRFSLVTILAVWALYLVLIGLRLVTLRVPHVLELEIRHFFTAATGAALNFVLYAIIRRLESKALTLRIVSSLTLALLAALLLSAANYGIMFLYRPDSLWSAEQQARSDIFYVSVQTLVENFFLFTAWAALYTAVTAAIREQIARKHAAAMNASARTAQLRALNYQLNPHFLFNALNTISALVIRGETEPAEHAIDALSGFLRITLSLEPTKTIRLQDEIKLQHSYLQIEQVRYANRLAVSIDVPQSLLNAQVPPLVLQPLVENVIKHAVVRSKVPVGLRLRASSQLDRLQIVVENDGPAVTECGTGVGLRNIRERLDLFYGANAALECSPMPDGGFRAVITLPLQA